MAELDEEGLRAIFLSDTKENLAGIEQGAIALDDGAGVGSDAMAEMQRHAHTLKGNAGSMGFREIAEVTHVLEELLCRLRDGRVSDRGAVVSVVLSMVDALRSLASASIDTRKTADLGPRTRDEDTTIRVDVKKLDALVSLVGISVARARLSLSLDGERDLSAVRNDKEELDRLCNELQDGVLGARMVPLEPFLKRCARIARDAAAGEGKMVRLTIEGGDVEVDARAMETLREALTHMINNAVAHGIEAPSDRVGAGKDPTGALSLVARRTSGGIVVELSDDGRGISYARVRSRAVELGWLGEHESAPEELLHAFLFRPGFSTSDEVTSIAGRGVGMDVVSKRVGALRGTASISSVEGRGTRVQLTFPLTIAIIEGFSVRVAEQTLMIPLEAVERCVEATGAGPDGRGLVEVDGQTIPFVRLRALLGIAGPPPGREHLVIVQHGNSRAGLAVDGILGADQAVLRPLGPLFPSGGGAAGAALTPSGALAVLLDLPAILARAAHVPTEESTA